MTAHPVDRLHELKVAIAELEAERDEIRQQIITGQCDPVGTEWAADVCGRTRRTIAVHEAEQLLPEEMFDLVCRSTPQQLVRLRKLGRNAPRRPRQGRKRR